MMQDTLKIQIKAWLKANGKDYEWLAKQCNVSKTTINNYLARKVIPANKIDILTSIIENKYTDNTSETSESTEDIKEPTRRRRRTRAQMREDLENEIQDAQEFGGYVDQEEEDKKYKLMGMQAELDYLDEVIKEREAARTMANFDMTDPENASCVAEGAVYRIVIPHNVLKIYKEEAKYLNKYERLPNRKVTVAMLIAKSITQMAETISKYEEADFAQTTRAIDLIEKTAQLKKNYNVLKAKQNLD